MNDHIFSEEFIRECFKEEGREEGRTEERRKTKKAMRDYGIDEDAIERILELASAEAMA